MYNKFLSLALLLCLAGSSPIALVAMENNDQNQDYNQEENRTSININNNSNRDDQEDPNFDADCNAIMDFLNNNQATDYTKVPIQNSELKLNFEKCFDKETENDARLKAVNSVGDYITMNYNSISDLIKKKIKFLGIKITEIQPKINFARDNSRKSFVGAGVAGAAAVFAARDNLKNLANSVYNVLKKATIGTKNLVVRAKNAAINDKDGNISKVKAGFVGAAGALTGGLYAYNKKTGKVFENYTVAKNKVAGKLSAGKSYLNSSFGHCYSTYYNNSRLQSWVNTAKDKLVNSRAAGIASGCKDKVKDFFIKQDGSKNYTNMCKVVIGASAVVIIYKLAQKLFEKGETSASGQLLVSFNDDSGKNLEDVNQDEINLQARMIAAIASGDANSLIAIKKEKSDMLTAEQIVLLDAAISELQNN